MDILRGDPVKTDKDEMLRSEAMESSDQREGMFPKLLELKAHQAFSRIYENLVTSAPFAPSKSILLCGSSRGEGATTVACGLSIVIAHRTDGKVLLIDGNCHNPGVFDLFGLSRQEKTAAGAEKAQSESTLVDVPGAASVPLVQAHLPNLFVMKPAWYPESSVHALEPYRFKQTLARLLEDYAFIVVDGPPVNSYPESVLFASQLDRVLLVLQAGVTRAPVVANAVERLRQAGCQRIDIVLNRRSFAIPLAVYKRL